MKNLTIYLLGLSLCISFVACDKELDALPPNAKVAEVLILDQRTAQIALNGAYYSFANASRDQTNWLNHQVIPSRLAGYLGYGFGASDEEENRNESAQYYWSECYTALNSANSVIRGVSDLADNKFEGTKKANMLAEARFLRAYAHFKLLSYYGQWFQLDSPLGILLRDELSTLTNVEKQRSSVEQSYDFILEDLDYAVANGAEENEKYYVTKWAAMVLKMRVLMSRGKAEDYPQVIALADQVLAGPYVLEDDPRNIFHSKGLSSNEVILGVQPHPQQELYYYNRSRQYWPGASGLQVAKRALLDLLKDDPRQHWLVGSESKYTNYSPDTYYFTKYQRENTEPSQLSESDYAIRLTEVYLLKAEAIVRSGGNLQDAKELVHLIQSKAGVTATDNNPHYLDVANADGPEELLVEIYRETSRSLVAEDGMEWMALLRLPMSTITQLRPTLRDPSQFIFPVPVAEFRLNPAFGEQNPGYSRN